MADLTHEHAPTTESVPPPVDLSWVTTETMRDPGSVGAGGGVALLFVLGWLFWLAAVAMGWCR